MENTDQKSLEDLQTLKTQKGNIIKDKARKLRAAVFTVLGLSLISPPIALFATAGGAGAYLVAKATHYDPKIKALGEEIVGIEHSITGQKNTTANPDIEVQQKHKHTVSRLVGTALLGAATLIPGVGNLIGAVSGAYVGYHSANKYNNTEGNNEHRSKVGRAIVGFIVGFTLPLAAGLIAGWQGKIGNRVKAVVKDGIAPWNAHKSSKAEIAISKKKLNQVTVEIEKNKLVVNMIPTLNRLGKGTKNVGTLIKNVKKKVIKKVGRNR